MRTIESADHIVHTDCVQLGAKLGKFRVVKIGVAHSGEIRELHLSRGHRVRRKSGSVRNQASCAIAAGERKTGCDSRSSGESREILAVRVNWQALMRILPYRLSGVARTTGGSVLCIVVVELVVVKILCCI